MDEVIPGLWIGDLSSAHDVEKLKEHGIFSILTAMRGKVTIHKTFIRHQIMLDDTEDADVLIHLLPSIRFIQAELDKGRGVLVHCLAGISRSTTIVAAYLMYSKKIDAQSALELIRHVRPIADPNAGFQEQLDLFHKSRFRISRREKAIRLFYMDKTVGSVMNGDGSFPETEMFAKYPRTPSDSIPNTPGGPRRRIRCKMCRQELATREHMLDHGQLGPATPVSPAGSPVTSRRPSGASQPLPIPRRPSCESAPRRPSRLSFSSRFGESLSMSSIEPTNGSDVQSGHPLHTLRNMSHTSMDPTNSTSALDIEDESETESNDPPPANSSSNGLSGPTKHEVSIGTAQTPGIQLSDAIVSTVTDDKAQLDAQSKGGATAADGTSPPVELPTTHFSTPSDLASQLFANSKLAALRSADTPASPTLVNSPPILLNAKCSGYFVEPMKWMEHFLSGGQLAGKIICPNKKCGAKLGNYDWAGVCCGCKQWVTPGFCINRSKVDEVV